MASFDAKSNNIKEALESNNFQVLSSLIHQLAGSSGSYGLTELSACCSSAELQLLSSTSLNQELTITINEILTLMKSVDIKC